MKRSGRAAVVVVLLAAAISGALTVSGRTLERMDGRNWDRAAKQARQQARSASKTFLEESGQSLMVPIDVEVFLIGFDGGGGFGHAQAAAPLNALLAARGGRVCPHSLDSAEELGVCFQVNTRVLGAEELGQEGVALLRRIEGHIKYSAKPTGETNGAAWARPKGRSGETPPEPEPRSPVYTVDAAGMEPMFDAFLEAAYAQSGGVHASAPHRWHQHNPIFVLNPSKVRANPKGAPGDAQHVVPNFVGQWANKNYSAATLEHEDAGYTYRYSYGGAGEATVWMSSRNYAVIDIAAGPTTYGPAASREGAVSAGQLPSLRDVYRTILSDLREVGPTLSPEQHKQVIAQHSQRALFEGALASTLAAAARALFAPDVATENIEYARNILIPVVLLTDYELAEEDYSSKLGQENFMHINLTHVERAVARMIDEDQNAVVISAHHPLSRHKGLAAALWKARRTVSEQALEHKAGKARVGYHTVSHTSVDPDMLVEELAQAADTLTHGLVSAAHTLSKEGAHPLEQLRHDGTRVVPVFVFSLMQAPDDIMFANREMVAAGHDAVVVLQLRQSAAWGGTVDRYFTGHVANGKRVTSDARDVTRHIIAGLAQAVAGVVPPYSRPLPPGHRPAGAAPAQDWRWAVGATPFGPYSAFAGASDILQNAARRNLLLSHVTAALRASQHKLDDLDAFVAAHFEGPWAAAGVGLTAAEGRRHFLDTVVSTEHGFKTALTQATVAELEGHMGLLRQHLETLAVDLYSHEFGPADKLIRDSMLPTAASLVAGLDATLSEAAGVFACCRARHVSAFSRVITTTAAAVAGFALVFAAAVGVAVATGRRRRLAEALQLPTYGLSSYSRTGSASLSRQHSWQL